MDKNEVLELLKKVSVSDKQVEIDLGLAPSTLGQIRKLKRDLPKKYDEAFSLYCAGLYVPVVSGSFDGVKVDSLKFDEAGQWAKFDSVLDYDTLTFAGQKLRLRVTAELVKELYEKYFGSVVEKKIEPSAVVSAEVSKPSMDDLRKLMDAPMKGIFDVEKEVVVEEVDYKKLYEECEFSDEYRALWERIKADDNVSTKDKNEWKLRLGAK